ncbi:DUF4238 domain-containing protein [Fibrobacter sp.]|uniref:DUF4238 domain-containing protein n=1 Tax=Fibrobacter sp. TaxID=35828 RepID=UPI00388D9B4A
MLRSHFIPQFILRAFCESDKIQYMDLASKTVESRNPRSVFSEVGYYPEQLERDLCDKIERKNGWLIITEKHRFRYSSSTSWQ